MVYVAKAACQHPLLPGYFDNALRNVTKIVSSAQTKYGFREKPFWRAFKKIASSIEVGKMNVFEVVEQRRSVRDYQDGPVPEEKLSRILEAARRRPSVRNSQD